MAGIGFLLRKLVNKDDFLGPLFAYFHAAVVAVGPWILVVFILVASSLFFATFIGIKQVYEFQAIFVYNILFSFILTAPLYMASSRYTADCLFKRDASLIPGVMITTLFFTVVPAILLGSIFYFFFTTMPFIDQVLSVINFTFLSKIWIAMLYLGCIRDFKAITYSWIIGAILSFVGIILLGQVWSVTGMLLGMNFGLLVLVFTLIAKVLAEYNAPFLPPKEYLFYFKHYKALIWSGPALFAGLWIDKVLLWFAPDHVVRASSLVVNPNYDGAMFASYLTIVPVMALFIFSIETNFFDSYIQYIRYIENNSPFALIEQERKNIVRKVIESSRNFIVLQGSISLLTILLAPTLFAFFNVNFLQLTIFRFGTLGAFFASLNLFMVILFSYFDSQKNMLFVSSLMLVLNTVFTLATLHMDPLYYGTGYALSMIVTFFISALLFVRFLQKLNYHIFISNVVQRHIYE